MTCWMQEELHGQLGRSRRWTEGHVAGASEVLNCDLAFLLKRDRKPDSPVEPAVWFKVSPSMLTT